MKCFYCDDLDGKASAFVVYQWAKIDNEAEYRRIGKPFHPIYACDRLPFEQIALDEQVYIINYPITSGDILHLHDITSNITWIDYHKTRATDNVFPFSIAGWRAEGASSCVATYKYLCWQTNGGEGIPHKVISLAVNPIPAILLIIEDNNNKIKRYGNLTNLLCSIIKEYDTPPKQNSGRIVLLSRLSH